MIVLDRDPANPLLKPNLEHDWESYATFNGCILKDQNTYHLLYRAMGKEQDYQAERLHLSVIGHAVSTDGKIFAENHPMIVPEESWELYGCEDPRVVKIDGTYIILYTALSEFPPTPNGIKVAVALSDDLKTIKERHLVTPFNAKAMTFFPQKINGKYVAFLTVHTDLPPSKIAIAEFELLEEMWSPEYWREWYLSLDTHVLPLQRMNSDQLEVGAPPVATEYGWLFVYANIRHYYTPGFRDFTIEAVLLDRQNPMKVIGRIRESLLRPEVNYEHDGIVPQVVFPSGAIIDDDTFYLYYGAADTTCCRASYPYKQLLQRIQTSDALPPKLEKFKENPILTAKPEHEWESQAVFNPAAFYDGTNINILYRAFSHDNTSTIGLAISADGYHIAERLIEPVYQPRKPFEDKAKTGVWSGCEDPRVTIIDGKLYMLYTAFDGVNVPRVAMTSIDLSDFKNRAYVWSEPVLISPPGIDDKDACIFPEKINGKYVFFHRIDNDIVIDYVDSLEAFNGSDIWLRTLNYIPLRANLWDEEKVGIAAPPYKTENGWFILYHGVSTKDHEYRVGAMLLDLNDPSKIVSRLHYPIIEPTEAFEREGLVKNVVFPCGMVVVNDILYVYYGGADSVICVASGHINDLIQNLLERRKRTFLI